MKRIPFLLIVFSLCAAPALRAQDAATQERLDKLTGQVQDLIASQEAVQKRLDALQADLRDLHDRVNSANTSAPTPEDLRRLGEKIEEVDRKRAADYERIVSQIENLGKAVTTAPPPPVRPRKQAAEEAAPASASDKGYEYVIKRGDSLSLIAVAFREKNIKVSVKEILDANPGVNPDRLRVGQKIFIPAPKQ